MPVTSFGRLLKAYRQAHNLTQPALAQRVHCAVVTIKKLEADTLRPSRQLATLLADTFTLAADDRATFMCAWRNELTAYTVPGHAGAATLPVPATPLIGRRLEIRHLLALLARPDVRFVTLTGVGGIGKTRIALHVAQELHAAFEDGVAFVSLAALQDAGAVAAAIAATLGITESAGQPVTTALQRSLHDKRLLLVLDNFEHLIAGAPVVGELVALCGGLKVLVTSRARLHLDGEYVYRAPPLAVPAPRPSLNVRAIGRAAAVRLFMARARMVHRDMVLTATNADVIAAICTHLQGLPLAIELAAARLNIFTPHALLAQLADPLTLLVAETGNLPVRHQAIRSTIDWSYALLSLDQRTLFRRLAVFVGGWTLEAAVAVCSPRAWSSDRLLRALAALVDQSLIQCSAPVAASHDGTASDGRFSLLEPIREYGLEQLAAHREVDTCRALHARYYVTLAQAAEPALRTANQLAWLDRLEQEHDNLRAALGRSEQMEDWQQVLELAGVLAPFWNLRGYRAEGRRWLAGPLAGGAAQVDRSAYARALTGDGMLAVNLGDLDTARHQLTAAVALWRSIGDRRGIASALELLATVQPFEFHTSRAQLEECLRLYGELEDPWGSAYTLAVLGDQYRWHGEYALARPHLEESLAIVEREGYGQIRAMILLFLGRLAHDTGDPDAAQTWFGACITHCRATGDHRNLLPALGGLAETHVARQPNAAVQATCAEGLAVSRRVGNRFWEAIFLQQQGTLARTRGDVLTAATRYRMSLLVWRSVGAPAYTGMALQALGSLAVDQDDWGQARDCFDEALVLARQSGDARELIRALRLRGELAHLTGDTRQALELYHASRRQAAAAGDEVGSALAYYDEGWLADQAGDAECTCACFGTSWRIWLARGSRWGMTLGLAGLAVMTTDVERAVCLLAAVQRMAAGHAASVSRLHRDAWENQLTKAGAQLDSERFAAARAAGQAMTLERAIAYMLDERGDAPAPPEAVRDPWHGTTAGSTLPTK